jgi:hypothetical protein
MDETGATGDWLSKTLIFGCIALLAHGIYYLLLGITNPILDFHYPRQTQTALSAYWLWRGGPWLAYQTPMVGFPWSVPMEFPVYQGLVAILRGLGIPIEVNGRLLSFAFYVACLWPLSMLCRALNFPRITFLIISALFLASPIYLYWSRTIMIESCALFFSFLWLALLARFLKSPSFGCFLGATVAGSLGILAKATTFPAFAVLGGILILVAAYRAWREERVTNVFPTLIFAAVACVVPFLIGVLWVVFSDAVKARSLIAARWTSYNLLDHNYGSWKQRISLAFWYKVVAQRINADIFGYGRVVAVLVVGAALMSRRYVAVIFSLSVAFLVPLLVFTNLHLVINYYQNANAIFALAAVGFAIAGLTETGRCKLAAIALAAVISGQLFYFHQIYAPAIAADYSKNRLLRIALLAREKTQPNESLIILAQGGNWSAAVPYYSERKSLVVPKPQWMDPTLMRQIFENPQAFLGDYRLGGIVFCRDNVDDYKGQAPLVSAFAANRTVLGEIDGCQLLAPQR